jgi:hypothetical protein
MDKKSLDMSFSARGSPQTTNGEDATKDRIAAHEFAGGLGDDEPEAMRVSDG